MNQNSQITISVLFILSFFIFSFLHCEKNSTSPEEEFDPTQNPYKLTKGEYPDWCPAGDSIAYVRDGNLWVFDIPGRKKWQLIKNATQPSFSPDGKQIAFERNKKIYTIDLNTKHERYLAEGITPSWSENGKWIAFANKTASHNTSDGEFVYGVPTPDSSLYYYDLDFEKIVTVTADNYVQMVQFCGLDDSMSFFEPEWAENDSTILFASEFSIWKIRRWGGGSPILERF